MVNHPDSRYAAACYCYRREYAIMLRDVCAFISLDDKHKIKAGEPNSPISSCSGTRKACSSVYERLTVGDHNFAKFSLVPSVIFVINIPEEITESWYSGM